MASDTLVASADHPDSRKGIAGPSTDDLIHQRENVLSGCLSNGLLHHFHFLHRFRYSIQVTGFLHYNSTVCLAVISIKRRMEYMQHASEMSRGKGDRLSSQDVYVYIPSQLCLETRHCATLLAHNSYLATARSK